MSQVDLRSLPRQRQHSGALNPVKTHLRRLRFERGEVSQAELADRVAVSRQTIIAIERGDYNPSVKLALQLANVLDTTVETLFELEATDVG